MKRTMKPILITATILLLAAGLTAAPAGAADVCQGKMIAFDKGAATLTVEEYDINFSEAAPYGNATGIITEFDLTKAKVGIAPEPGDILRISYTNDGAKNVALKVMNVSKQDLRKK